MTDTFKTSSTQTAAENTATGKPLTRLIYASHPFGFDEGMFRQILGAARRNNTRDGITGSLICREDLFLQLLEGPNVKVRATFDRIQRDDRHVDVTELVNTETNVRLFPDWAMRHDPAQSWMWSSEEVRNRAIDKATPDEVVTIFKRIALGLGTPRKTPVQSFTTSAATSSDTPADDCPHTKPSNQDA
ncbi:MAG: BLUF domain-containing protein [Pseudomonadota bacterium]